MNPMAASNNAVFEKKVLEKIYGVNLNGLLYPAAHVAIQTQLLYDSICGNQASGLMSQTEFEETDRIVAFYKKQGSVQQ